MINNINTRQRKKFGIALLAASVSAVGVFLTSLMVGQYGFIGPIAIIKVILNSLGCDYDLPNSYGNILEFIRIPRAIASFLVGGALSIAGLVYQNTFNNKLVSPDILGVSAGACVGAGLAILFGASGSIISISAFAFGSLAVMVSLFLPKLFRNKSSITLVLSGIIVGAFMNSVIGLIKYLADRDDKLAEITFWMMGSVTGITMKEILFALPFIIIPSIVLLLMSHRIDVVSLGMEEAQSLGINYKSNRLVIVICSTILTAASVSISGNVGWIKVDCERNVQNRYYLSKRFFDESEVKILCDAVRSSYFISDKNSKDLINKLKQFVGPTAKEDVVSSAFVDTSIKTKNNEVIRNANKISKAISEEVQIAFKYFDYDVDGKRIFKHNKKYTVSPYAMVINDGKYYIAAYQEDEEKVKTFRVDKMDTLSITGIESFPKPKDFSTKQFASSFDMLSGYESEVELLCDADIRYNIYDKFGTGIKTDKVDDEHFKAFVTADVSSTFFGWVLGFGGKVKISGPQNVVDEYKKLSKMVTGKLGKNKDT